MSEQNQTEPGNGNLKSSLSASLDWIQSITALLLAVFRLGIAEVSLAREDLSRLILVGLLIVPMFLLTWIAVSILAAWVVFEMTLSALSGFATFAAIQLITSLTLISKFNTYRRSLSLPATRAQILAIIEEVRNEARHETSRQTSADRET